MNSLVEIILNNIMQLMPFRIIMSYEQGVRWTLGRNPTTLAPGFHLCIWVLHHVEVVITAEEVLNLPTQSVVTKDGMTVCFSANIGRYIVDAVKHCCAVTNFDASTEGLAMTHLAERIRKLTYEELISDLSSLEKSLKGTLATRYKDWGAAVTTVGFTDFVRAKHQIRMFGDKK